MRYRDLIRGSPIKIALWYDLKVASLRYKTITRDIKRYTYIKI